MHFLETYNLHKFRANASKLVCMCLGGELIVTLTAAAAGCVLVHWRRGWVVGWRGTARSYSILYVLHGNLTILISCTQRARREVKEVK